MKGLVWMTRGSGTCSWAGWTFPCEPEQVPTVRRMIDAALDGCVRRDDVVTVADELAANAVTHSRSRHGGQIAVELDLASDRVELRVHDDGGDTVPC